MSLELASPWALAALASVLVPILVHLVRRAEHRVTPFAALRFLVAAGLPRRRIRLAELALLLLRCMLLAGAALWLAQPFVRRPLEARRVVAVETTVPPDAVHASLAGAPGDEAVWLAPGFPALSQRPPAGTQPLASLVRELDASLAADAELVLVVPERVAGLDGARPVLGRGIEWHVVADSMTRKPPAPRAPLRVAWHVADDEVAERSLAAVAAAWAAAPGSAAVATRIAAGAAIPDGTDAVVWIGDAMPAALARWIERGGMALVAGETETGTAQAASERVLVRDGDGAVLVRERSVGLGVLRTLAVPFGAETLPRLHDASFPAELRSWLVAREPLPTLGAAESLRPVRGAAVHAPPRVPLAPWLALAVSVLFLVERTWAAGLARRRAT